MENGKSEACHWEGKEEGTIAAYNSDFFFSW